MPGRRFMTSGLEGDKTGVEVDRIGLAVDELGVPHDEARESSSGLVENGCVLYRLNFFSWLGK